MLICSGTRTIFYKKKKLDEQFKKIQELLLTSSHVFFSIFYNIRECWTQLFRISKTHILKKKTWQLTNSIVWHKESLLDIFMPHFIVELNESFSDICYLLICFASSNWFTLFLFYWTLFKLFFLTWKIDPSDTSSHLRDIYSSYSEKQENKIKCIIHYFERICLSMPEGSVSFERKVLPLEQLPLCVFYPKADFWIKSVVSLCTLEVRW
jgi:hypothetical protein